jgi:hypothetical protein
LCSQHLRLRRVGSSEVIGQKDSLTSEPLHIWISSSFIVVLTPNVSAGWQAPSKETNSIFEPYLDNSVEASSLNIWDGRKGSLCSSGGRNWWLGGLDSGLSRPRGIRSRRS